MSQAPLASSPARNPLPRSLRHQPLLLWAMLAFTVLPACSTLQRWLVPPGRVDDARRSRTQLGEQQEDARAEAEVILVVAALPGEATTANALALRRGTVLARGNLQDLESVRGPATRVVRLPGGVAENGLSAAHVRLEQRLMAVDAVDLHEAKTVADVVAALELAKPMVLSESGWLWADGVEPALWAKLSSSDLDRALGRVPVLVTPNGKPGAMANAAMTVRLAESGLDLEELRGRLDERALRLAWQRLPAAPSARLRPLLLGMFAEAQKHGITEVQAVGATSSLLDALHILDREGRLALRVQLFLDAERPEGRELLLPKRRTPEDSATGEASGRKSMRESLVEVAGVSLQLDGPVASGTAALAAPYADLPRAGTLTYTDVALGELLELAQRAGVQVSVEAHGDAALAQLTRTLTALRGAPASLRVRVQLPEVVTTEALEALKTLGAQCTIEPLVTPKDMEVLRKRLGASRMADVDRARSLAQACPIRVALNLTRPQPLAVLDRLTRQGAGAEAMETSEAWQAMGAGGSGDMTPRLMVGDRADLVVWSRNPRLPGKTPPQVMASVVGGTVTLLVGRDLD